MLQAEQTLASVQVLQLLTLQERQVPLSVKLKRVKHSPQTSLFEQTLQFPTAHEKGLQEVLTSWKLAEQFAQTFSAEQIAQFSMEHERHEPLMAWRLLRQVVQNPVWLQASQLVTLQLAQMLPSRMKPVLQAVQMEALPRQALAIQLGSVHLKTQVLFSRLFPV